MGYREAPAVCTLNHFAQRLITHLHHRTARCAYTVNVRVRIVRFLVLRTVIKLMANNQTGIDEQLHRIVQCSTAHVKLAGIHQLLQPFHREMPLYGVDSIKNSKTLLRFAKALVLQVLLKSAPYSLLDVIFHITRKAPSKDKGFY